MLKQQRRTWLSKAAKRARDFFSKKRYTPTQEHWHRITEEGFLVSIRMMRNALSVSVAGTNAVRFVTSDPDEAAKITDYMKKRFGRAESILENSSGSRMLYFIFVPILPERRLSYCKDNKRMDEDYNVKLACDRTGESWGVIDVEGLEPTTLSQAIAQIDRSTAPRR